MATKLKVMILSPDPYNLQELHQALMDQCLISAEISNTDTARIFLSDCHVDVVISTLSVYELLELSTSVPFMLIDSALPNVRIMINNGMFDTELESLLGSLRDFGFKSSWASRLHGAPSHPLKAPLTLRENEVLRLLLEGMTDKQIAKALSIGSETARTHVKHIREKFEAKDRIQVILKALA